MANIDAQDKPQSSRPARLVFTVVVAMCIVWVGLLFVIARQSDWTLGWLYVGLFAANYSVCLVCLLICNPIVIARRIMIGRGTKTWDLLWTAVCLPLIVAIGVVAVRDLNTRPADPTPLGTTWLIGLCIFVFAWALLTWSMAVNPFFEKTVRIQTDQGHHVIDSGPYAFVRHPGYVGINALLLSTPLLLASAWTFIPSGMTVLWLVIRTVLEDRTLQAELPRYREYAARVRFRLIPGIW